MSVTIPASAASASTKGAFVHLASFISNGTSAGTTFNNIPQNYQDLMIVTNGRAERAVTVENLLFAPNTNVGNTNYSFLWLYGAGAGVGSFRSSDQGLGVALDHFTGSTAPLGIWGSGVTHVLDYANPSAFKTIISRGSAELGNSGEVSLSVNLWRQTTAITSFYAITYNNLVPGSRIDLYAIRRSGQ
jgi:hypothetical protein